MSAAKSTRKSTTNRPAPAELTAESLVGIEVFRRLSATDRGKLAALCQGRRYAVQQRVLSHKDDSRDVYFIISGKVRATISPSPTHADIASRISTHREAVTREYHDLAQAGVIDQRRGELVIHDVARLETMVREVMGS